MSYVNAYTKHLQNHKSWLKKSPKRKKEENADSLLDAYERSKKYEKEYNKKHKQLIRKKSIKSNIYKPTFSSKSKVNHQPSINMMQSVDDFRPTNDQRYQEYKQQKNGELYKKHKYKLQLKEALEAQIKKDIRKSPKIRKGLNSSRNRMASLSTQMKTPRKQYNPLYKYDDVEPVVPEKEEPAYHRKDSLSPWPSSRRGSDVIDYGGSNSNRLSSQSSHIDDDAGLDGEKHLEKYKHQTVATFLQKVKQGKRKRKRRKLSKAEVLREKFKSIILNMLKIQSRRARKPVQEELLATFRAFDSDNDGQICAEDLYRGMQVLGKVMPLKEIRALIRAVDQDGNLTLDYGEYLAIILAEESEMAAAIQSVNEKNNSVEVTVDPESPAGILSSKTPTGQMNDSLISSLQQQINFLMDKNKDLQKVNGFYKSEMDELKRELIMAKNKPLSTPRSVSRGSNSDHMDPNLLSPYTRNSIDNHVNMVPMSDSPTPRNSITKHRRLFKRFVQRKKKKKKDNVFSLTAVKRKSGETSSDSEQLSAFQLQYQTIDKESSSAYKRGCQFYLEGSHYEAKKCFNEVLSVLTKRKYDEHFQKRFAKSHHNLGLIYYASKMYDEAIESYSTALSTFETFHLESERAQCLTNMGLAYYRAENNEKAMEVSKLAHTLYENVLQAEEKDHAQTLLNISFIVRHSSNTSKLLKYALLALAQYEKLDDKKYIMYFNRLVGDAYLLLLKYEDARPYFIRGIKYFDKTEEYEMIGHFNKGLGIVERMSGKKKVSQQCFSKALEAFEKSSHKKGQISCHYNLGHLFNLHGEYLHASEHFSRAITLIENKIGVQKIKEEKNIAVKPQENKNLQLALLNCYYHLALSYHEEELFDDAIEYYEKTIDLYEQELTTLLNYEKVHVVISSMRQWNLAQSSSTGGGGSSSSHSTKKKKNEVPLALEKPHFSESIMLYIGHCFHNLGSIQFTRSLVTEAINSLTTAHGIYVHVVDELKANQACLKKLSLAYKSAGEEDVFYSKFVERSETL